MAGILLGCKPFHVGLIIFAKNLTKGFSEHRDPLYCGFEEEQVTLRPEGRMPGRLPRRLNETDAEMDLTEENIKDQTYTLSRSVALYLFFRSIIPFPLTILDGRTPEPRCPGLPRSPSLLGGYCELIHLSAEEASISSAGSVPPFQVGGCELEPLLRQEAPKRIFQGPRRGFPFFLRALSEILTYASLGVTVSSVSFSPRRTERLVGLPMIFEVRSF